MKNSRCSRNICPPRARPFLSEVHCMSRNHGAYNSPSEKCLIGGLRSAIDQLYTPRGFSHMGYTGPSYFYDILCTVNSLEGEFKKLEDLFSSWRVENTNNHGDRKRSKYSVDDMIYLNLAAKSLLSLINNLKNDLLSQVGVADERNCETLCRTSSLINTLEDKLYDLMKKLEEFKLKFPKEPCCCKYSGRSYNSETKRRSHCNTQSGTKHCSLDNCDIGCEFRIDPCDRNCGSNRNRISHTPRQTSEFHNSPLMKPDTLHRFSKLEDYGVPINIDYENQGITNNTYRKPSVEVTLKKNVRNRPKSNRKNKRKDNMETNRLENDYDKEIFRNSEYSTLPMYLGLSSQYHGGQRPNLIDHSKDKHRNYRKCMYSEQRHGKDKSYITLLNILQKLEDSQWPKKKRTRAGKDIKLRKSKSRVRNPSKNHKRKKSNRRRANTSSSKVEPNFRRRQNNHKGSNSVSSTSMPNHSPEYPDLEDVESTESSSVIEIKPKERRRGRSYGIKQRNSQTPLEHKRRRSRRKAISPSVRKIRNNPSGFSINSSKSFKPIRPKKRRQKRRTRNIFPKVEVRADDDSFNKTYRPQKYYTIKTYKKVPPRESFDEPYVKRYTIVDENGYCFPQNSEESNCIPEPCSPVNCDYSQFFERVPSDCQNVCPERCNQDTCSPQICDYPQYENPISGCPEPHEYPQCGNPEPCQQRQSMFEVIPICPPSCEERSDYVCPEYESIYTPNQKCKPDRKERVSVENKRSIQRKIKRRVTPPNKRTYRPPVRRHSPEIAVETKPRYKTERKYRRKSILKDHTRIESTESLIVKREVSSSSEKIRPRKHASYTYIYYKEKPSTGRQRHYVRFGKFYKESSEQVIEFDMSAPLPPDGRPPSSVHIDTFSRGTSTEAITSVTKKTSTNDIIKIVRAIGTNTMHVSTREQGIDPIPESKRTLLNMAEMKNQFTNTEKIKMHSIGIDSRAISPKTEMITTGTDPWNYLILKTTGTNTVPVKKMDIVDTGTDPKPEKKVETKTTATDPLYYLVQRNQFTNTTNISTVNAETETLPKPPVVTEGTDPVWVETMEKQTSYDKLETKDRGNNPIPKETAEKWQQFDTIEEKPVVKTAYTGTDLTSVAGKMTQTSFKEEREEKPSMYNIGTQTIQITLMTRSQQVDAPTILKKAGSKETQYVYLPCPCPCDPENMNQIITEVNESKVSEPPEEPEAPKKDVPYEPGDLLIPPPTPEPFAVKTPSQLSMHLVIEKCHEEIYRRRKNICMPVCLPYGESREKMVIGEIKRSNSIRITNRSHCDLPRVSLIEEETTPTNDLELSLTSNVPPKHPNKESTLNNENTLPGKGQRKTKLSEDCGMNVFKRKPIKQNRITRKSGFDEDTSNRVKSTTEIRRIDDSEPISHILGWKDIAETMK